MRIDCANIGDEDEDAVVEVSKVVGSNTEEVEDEDEDEEEANDCTSCFDGTTNEVELVAEVDEGSTALAFLSDVTKSAELTLDVVDVVDVLDVLDVVDVLEVLDVLEVPVLLVVVVVIVVVVVEVVLVLSIDDDETELEYVPWTIAFTSSMKFLPPNLLPQPAEASHKEIPPKCALFKISLVNKLAISLGVL